MTNSVLRIQRSLAFAVVVAAVVSLVPSAAFAQSVHARVSGDIADRLARHLDDPTTVIVAADQGVVDQIALRYGAQVTKRVHGGAVMAVTGGQLEALSQDPDVSHIAGDVPVVGMTAEMTAATGADQAWAGIDALASVTGRGIGVAVIDSGVAPQSAAHNRVVFSKDFTSSPRDGQDPYGHGTHVAGIISDDASDGYPGMAPDANIVNLRALGPDGSGATSDVINAIDWAIDHRAQFNIRVINLSLGHPVFESYKDDPLCDAARRAVSAGILVVAAAGNFGKATDGRPIVGGIVSPGNAPEVLTVGALNTMGTVQRSDDVMATYSSRGPTVIDGLVKPELVAPGNRITSALSPGSEIAQTYADRAMWVRGNRGYIELSGTSMSTAVVSGAAALLLQARPALTPVQVKIALQMTASAVPGAGLIEAGAGSLNVVGALALVSGPFDSLHDVTIGGELAKPVAFAFGDVADIPSNRASATILVWGSNGILSFDNPQPLSLLFLESEKVAPDILVWGNTINADVLVWGSTVRADILVWGNILVWGSNVTPDILVWGNGSVQSDVLVWGETGHSLL
jgi:serine protease AprX